MKTETADPRHETSRAQGRPSHTKKSATPHLSIKGFVASDGGRLGADDVELNAQARPTEIVTFDSARCAGSYWRFAHVSRDKEKSATEERVGWDGEGLIPGVQCEATGTISNVDP